MKMVKKKISLKFESKDKPNKTIENVINFQLSTGWVELMLGNDNGTVELVCYPAHAISQVKVFDLEVKNQEENEIVLPDNSIIRPN